MFGCLFASFCSFSFFLPKHHNFAQLNVPNASRWSVLIPKCFISRLLIRFTRCYESFVYLVLEITATLEKNLRKHDVFSSTSRKFCSRNEKIYHTSNVNRVAKTKNTRLRWVGRISGNDTVFLFCFVFLLFYNYE